MTTDRRPQTAIKSSKLISTSANWLIITSILAFCIPHTASAQLLNSFALDTATAYTSMEEALKNPNDVYHLNLRKQKLTKFPKEIFELKNLNIINLSKNKIIEIPTEISQLQYLQKLNLSKNKLETLPKEIGELKALKHLKLGQNNIVYLPRHIGELTNLVYLDLWNNDLSTLPKEIGNLTNLKKLDLRMIQLNKQKQNHIKSLLPNTEIYFSNACNCD